MISLEALAQAILDGAVAGLGRGAEVVARLARAKAPVRHIFSGSDYVIRHQTMAEINQNREARDAGLRFKSPKATVVQPGDVPGRWLMTITGKHPPVRWRQRRIAAAQQALEAYDAEMVRRRTPGYVHQKTLLDRRGAYEVRSQRAKHLTWGHSYIGGTLRDSISATPPRLQGQGAEAWVIAEAPYAKFQEFGTRHNAAHPFLRPAAEESRGEVVQLIADAVKSASRTGVGSASIEIVVRI